MMYTNETIYKKVRFLDIHKEYGLFASDVRARGIYLGNVTEEDWKALRRMLKANNIRYAYDGTPTVKYGRDYTLFIFERSYNYDKCESVYYGLAKGKHATRHLFYSYKDYIAYYNNYWSAIRRSTDILNRARTSDTKTIQYHKDYVAQNYSKLKDLEEEVNEYFEEHPSKLSTFVKHCFGY